MNPFLRGAVAVVFVSMLGLGCAGTKAAGNAVASEIPGVSHDESGVIDQVGEDRVSVAGMKKQNGPLWFQLGADTRIERDDGSRAELTDLMPGTPVTITWSSATGAERAYRIQILTGSKAAKVMREAQQRGYGGAGTQGQQPGL